MNFNRAQSWLSMAVLVVGIVAPLRGLEVRFGGSEAVAVSGTDWNSGCGATRRNLKFQEETREDASQSGQTCLLDSIAGNSLVESSDLVPAGWPANRFEESIGANEFGGETLPQVSSAHAASFIAEVAGVPPEDAPTGTKVPEPSTLVLLGAGLIAVSQLSRVKISSKKLLGMIAARSSTVHLQSAAGD